MSEDRPKTGFRKPRQDGDPSQQKPFQKSSLSNSQTAQENKLPQQPKRAGFSKQQGQQLDQSGPKQYPKRENNTDNQERRGPPGEKPQFQKPGFQKPEQGAQNRESKLKPNQMALDAKPYKILAYDELVVIIFQQSKYAAANIKVFEKSEKSDEWKLIKQFNLISPIFHIFDVLQKFEHIFLATNRGVFDLNMKKLDYVEKIFETDQICKCLCALGHLLFFVHGDLECGSKLAFNEIICIDSYKVVKQHQISGNILGLQAQQDPNRLFVLRNEILTNQFKKFKHLTEAEQTVETCDLTLTVLTDDLTQISHSVYAMNDFPFELAQGQVHDEIKQVLFINGQPSAYASNISDSVMHLTPFYLSQLIGQKVNIKSLTCENAFWRAGLDRFAIKFQLDYKDGAIVLKNPQTLFRELKLPRSSYHLIDFCANGALYEKVHEDVSDNEEEQEEKEELMWIVEFRKEGRQPIEGISVDIAV
ncbi:Conserved_hypothetical protein [Hexamita inflata]|uniref:Uncharacterized protein n=1 Tax=Hexamita inflata TaxID=28002 RepID=A0AA86RYX1_9EUKA|nr:Conserved hypothetical protein [Hexamita inflata]